MARFALEGHYCFRINRLSPRAQQFTFNYFNDIHVYDMASHRWVKHTLLSAPPPAALCALHTPHALAAGDEASAATAAAGGGGGAGSGEPVPFLGARHRSRSIGDGADLVSELLPPRLGFHAFCVVRLGPQRSPFLFIFGGRSDSENYKYIALIYGYRNHAAVRSYS